MREVANIIRSELKDPRVGAIVSVLRADVSQDMKHCRVSVSVLGNVDERENTMRVLDNASGFIRKRIAERINPRVTPDIKFVYDDSLEYGLRMDKLIEETIKKDTSHE
jgi:ribosome-binding factor A